MKIANSCICCGQNRLLKNPAVLMPFLAYRTFGWEPFEITESMGFQDLQNGTVYPLCQSLGCEDCGALFLDIRFDDEEMANLYTGYRSSQYVTDRSRFESGYGKTNDFYKKRSSHITEVEQFIEEHIGVPGTILDIGGDDGINTPFLGRTSKVMVDDLSDKALIPGVSRFDRQTTSPGTVDLFISSSVIEHVPYPAEHLSSVKRMMSSDAFFYLEVPYEDLMQTEMDTASKLKRKRHWHEHINFFSKESLIRLTEDMKLVAERQIEVDLGRKKAIVLCYLLQLPG